MRLSLLGGTCFFTIGLYLVCPGCTVSCAFVWPAGLLLGGRFCLWMSSAARKSTPREPRERKYDDKAAMITASASRVQLYSLPTSPSRRPRAALSPCLDVTLQKQFSLSRKTRSDRKNPLAQNDPISPHDPLPPLLSSLRPSHQSYHPLKRGRLGMQSREPLESSCWSRAVRIPKLCYSYFGLEHAKHASRLRMLRSPNMKTILTSQPATQELRHRHPRPPSGRRTALFPPNWPQRLGSSSNR